MNTTTAQNLIEKINDVGAASPNEPFMKWGDVPMHRAVFEGENKLEVIVGTSAPRGGSYKHGAQTVFMLHDRSNTAIQSVRVMVKQANGIEPCGLLFVVGGDSEAITLADALEFAAKTIRAQVKANHTAEG